MKADVKGILKEAGLEIAEGMSVLTVKACFKAIPKILQATENKYDDLLIPVISILEPKIIEVLDKIDGEVG